MLQKLIERTRRHKKIIIYGAGHVGQMVYRILSDYCVSVSLFVQSKLDVNEKCEGIPLMCISDVSSNDKNKALIILAVQRGLLAQLQQNVQRYGFRHVYSLDESEISAMEDFLQQKACIRNQMMISRRNDISFYNQRILLMAPHPDDEVIGCGGLLALYGNHIDVLCINSSGVKYEWNEQSAEQIADERIAEFYDVMSMIGVRYAWIAKIWGTPPMFEGIESNFKEYIGRFDYSQYDYIFVPDLFDGHREHRYLSNELFPCILGNVSVKDTLQVGFYEVWATLSTPNFYLDISSVVEEKRRYICRYRSRNKARYDERILGLNRYRGLVAGCEYAEAYKIISVQEYRKCNFSRDWSR